MVRTVRRTQRFLTLWSSFLFAFKIQQFFNYVDPVSLAPGLLNQLILKIWRICWTVIWTVFPCRASFFDLPKKIPSDCSCEAANNMDFVIILYNFGEIHLWSKILRKSCTTSDSLNLIFGQIVVLSLCNSQSFRDR